MTVQQILISIGGSGGGGSTWNPADKDPHITLSNGDLTASINTSQSGSVRGTTSHDAAGDHYFEYTVTAVDATGYTGLGIGQSTATITQGPGVGTDSMGWINVAGGRIYYNSGFISFLYTVAAADVVGMQVKAGELIIWKNGVSLGVAKTGLSGDWFPMFGTINAIGSAQIVTLNTGGSAFYAGLPSGSTAWG